MESGIFDEYLVKLGFDNDPAGYAKFRSTLTDAAGIAADRTKSIVEDLGKWQGAIVGGFAAIGGAALGIADKVADADLGFQLFATKMYMGTDAAKSLSIATEVLGHSLDEIAWNPELHRRFDILLSDQERMAHVMGQGYEPALYNIREIRFQFSRLQDELEFGFLPGLVSNVFDDLAGGNALDKLEKLNDWVLDHLPEITATFSKHLVPVLNDAKQVLGDVAGMFEEAGVAFTNLIGLFSGDHSIEGTTFNFEHLLTALDHASHGFATFVGWITEAERMLAHLASAAALMASGHFKDAGAELSAAMRDFTTGSGSILGGIVGTGAGAGIGALAGGIVGSVVPGLGTVVGAGLGGSVGAVFGGTQGAIGGAAAGHLKQTLDPSSPEHGFYVPTFGTKTDQPTGNIHDLIESLASQFGVSPLLAHAMAKQESGERQYGGDGSLVTSGVGPNGGAKGVFQLEDSTAQQYGVNSLDAAGNITGGLHYIADLLKKYNGNTEEALAAYNWGPKHVDDFVKRRDGFDASYLPQDVQTYIARIEHEMMQGEIHVTNNIYPSPHQSPQEIGLQAADQTVAQIRTLSRRQNTSNIAALGTPYQ